MNPPLQKLAIVFMVAAIVLSSAAWGISYFVNRSGAPGAGVATTATSTLNGSAFAANSPQYNSDGTLAGAGPNGQNLTANIANLFAQELVSVNPQGPQAQPNNMVSILSPTTTDITAYLGANQPSTSVLMPPVDQSKITVIANPTSTDTAAYVAAVTQIESTLTSNSSWVSGLQNVSAGGSSSGVGSTGVNASQAQDWLQQGSQAFGAAETALYAVKVPAPLLKFHTDLLAYIGTVNASLTTMQQDPVSATILSKDLPNILSQETATLNVDAQQAQANLPTNLSLGTQAEESSLFAQLFGIDKVYATGIPVVDIVAILQAIESYIVQIEQDYGTVAVDILKAVLVNELSKSVLAWVVGSGDPGYVTNWNTYLNGAGAGAGQSVISAETGNLCGNSGTNGAYGQIIASALGDQNQNSSGNTTGNTGDAAGCPSNVSTVSVNGFQPAVFISDSQNNLFADLTTVGQDAGEAAAGAEATAADQAIAGNGYPGASKCSDGSTPIGGNCPDGATLVITSPGVNQKDLVSKSLTNTFDLVDSADYGDIDQLESIVTSAVINSVLNGSNGIFGLSSSGNNTATVPPAGASVSQQITTAISNLTTAYNNENSAVGTMGQAYNILSSAIPTACGNSSSVDGAAIISEAKQDAPTVQQDQTQFQTQTQTIQALIGKLQTLGANATQAQLNAIVTQSSIQIYVTNTGKDASAGNTTLQQATKLLGTCST